MNSKTMNSVAVCVGCFLLGLPPLLYATDDVADSLKIRAERVVAALSESGNGNPDLLRQMQHDLIDTLTEIEDRLAPAARYHARQSAKHQVRLQRLNGTLDALESSSDAKTAESRDDLRRLTEAWEAGNCYVPESTERFVHWVHAHDISATEPPKREDGRQAVTVRVSDLGQPAVIVLSSSTGTAWSLEIEENAQVDAVLSLGNANIVTCDRPLLVYRRRGQSKWFTRESRSYLRSTIAYEIGQPADVLLQVFQTQQPVQISANDKQWTRAYLDRQFTKLSQFLRSEMNTNFEASHGQLQFQAIEFEGEGYSRTTSFSQFGLRGPIAGTAEPADRSLWNRVQTPDGQSFALMHSGSLAEWSSRMDAWVPRTMPSQQAGGTYFGSICWDTKRGRLLLLDHDQVLYTLDLETSHWNIIRKGMRDLVAIAYRTSDDTIVGLRQSPNRTLGHEDEDVISLAFFDANGELIRETKTDCIQPIQSHHERASNSLTVTDRFLIAVQPPAGGSHKIPPRSVIRVFDLQDGRLLYDYMLPPAGTVELPKSNYPQETAPTRFAAFVERLETAERSIMLASRKTRVDSAQVAAMQEQLQRLREPAISPKLDRTAPNIHWVRIAHEPAPIIRITDQTGPVVLALGSFKVRQWQVEVAPGVDLREVIFVGDKVPEINGLPAGTPIRAHTVNDVAEEDRAIQQTPAYQKSMINQLVDGSFATDLDLSRMSSRSRIVLGAGDADWAVKRILEELNQVISNATKLANDGRLPVDFRFPYLYQGPLPELGINATHLFAIESNLEGPILQTAKMLDLDIIATSITTTGDGDWLVGSRDGGLHALRFVEDSWQGVPITSAPQQRGTYQMMFDPTREKLFCFSSTGLHVRTKEQWGTQTVNADFGVALCRDNQRDCFYNLIRENRHIVAVHTISSAGKTVRRRKLPVPIECGYKASARLVFAFCDSKYIFLVVREGLGRDSKRNRCLLLDVSNLSILHDGPFRPHIVSEPLTTAAFETYWSQLATADGIELEACRLGLLGGGESTAERIRARLGVSNDLTQEQVKTLVQQLDADTFAERDKAYSILQTGAQTHADYFRGLQRAELSAEQWLRIQSLLAIQTADRQQAKRANVLLNLLERQAKPDSTGQGN